VAVDGAARRRARCRRAADDRCRFSRIAADQCGETRTLSALFSAMAASNIFRQLATCGWRRSSARAPVRSCLPRRRTRSGCPARRRGIRSAPGSFGRFSSPRSARRPAQTARQGRHSDTPPCWASR
jgi:hypothetical protein